MISSGVKNLGSFDQIAQQQRHARTQKMMKKLQEAKITSSEKPFIHAMYENYHKTFCSKFKIKFLDEIAQMWQKRDGRNISTEFNRNNHNISEIKQNSQSQKSDTADILHEFQVQKLSSNQSSHNIVKAEIKKTEFYSQIRPENAEKQMKKRKDQKIMDIELVQKVEQPKKQILTNKFQIKEQTKRKNQIQKETKQNPKSKSSSKQSQKPQIKVEQQVIVIVPLKNDKISFDIQKKQEPDKILPPIKNTTLSNEVNKDMQDQQDYEQVQQDDSPSFYQQKLRQIDEAKLTVKSNIQSRTQPPISQQLKSPASHIVTTRQTASIQSKTVQIQKLVQSKQQLTKNLSRQVKQNFDPIQIPHLVAKQTEQLNKQQFIEASTKQQEQNLHNQKCQKPSQHKSEIDKSNVPSEFLSAQASLQDDLTATETVALSQSSKLDVSSPLMEEPSRLTQSIASKNQQSPNSLSKQVVQNQQQESEESSSQSSSDSQQEQTNKLSETEQERSVEFSKKDSNSRFLTASLNDPQSYKSQSQKEVVIQENLQARVKKIIDNFLKALDQECYSHNH